MDATLAARRKPYASMLTKEIWKAAVMHVTVNKQKWLKYRNDPSFPLSNVAAAEFRPCTPPAFLPAPCISQGTIFPMHSLVSSNNPKRDHRQQAIINQMLLKQVELH
ncbi:unnamed protein product [Caretta caretta]